MTEIPQKVSSPKVSVTPPKVSSPKVSVTPPKVSSPKVSVTPPKVSSPKESQEEFSAMIEEYSDDESSPTPVPQPVSHQEEEVKQQSVQQKSPEKSPVSEKSPSPAKGGCVFVIIKGARKGQLCGENIASKYAQVKMCTAHGKKQ